MRSPFEWQLPSTPISPGAALEIRLSIALFAEDAGSRDYSQTVVLDGIGLAPTVAAQRTLTVNARGYAYNCSLPDELDFGYVRVGDVATRTIDFENPSDADVLPVVSPSQNLTFYWPELVSTPPRRTQTLEINFRPTVPGEAVASLFATAGPGCSQQAIRLRGHAVPRLLEWEPAQIDCDWVLLDETRHRTLTFTNHGPVDATPTLLDVDGPATVSRWPSVVSAGTSVDVDVECKPVQLGSQQASIRFNVAREGIGEVPVLMQGGGPRISSIPQPVNFGVTARGVPTTRVFSIVNTGVFVADAGATSNLHLEVDGGTPIVHTNPRVTAQARGQYDPAAGILAGNSLTFEATVVPPAVGDWTEIVPVRSNDPRQPVYNIVLIGQAIDVPPCDLSVSATSIDFGVLYEGETRRRLVTLTNRGGSTCLLSDLDVDGLGLAGGFALEGGRIDVLMLPSGGQLALEISAKGFPSGTPGLQSGRFEYEVSDPAAPRGSIPLTASSATLCASVIPEPVDLGDVPVGCRARREITLTNTCLVAFRPWPFNVNGQGFSVDAGTPALLVSPDSHIAEVWFEAADAGVHHGELSIGVPGGTRSIGLIARAVPEPTVTERFVQRASGALDVIYSTLLLPGDPSDGGTVPDESVTRLVGVALNRIVDAGVDVRVAALVGDWDHAAGQARRVPWRMGEYLRLADAGTYFADNQSAGPHIVAQRAAQTAAYTNAATSFLLRGSAQFEAIYRSATPPLVHGSNFQFRRTNTSLLVLTYDYLNEMSSTFRHANDGAEYPSPAFQQFPIEYYHSRFDLIWGRGQYAFMSIAGTSPASACPEPPLPYHYARFVEMAQQTGGASLDICSPTLDADLASSMLGWLDSRQSIYFLNGRPSSGSPIIVAVGGTPLAPSEWNYSSTENAVSLNTVPPVGSQITVTFFPECG